VNVAPACERLVSQGQELGAGRGCQSLVNAVRPDSHAADGLLSRHVPHVGGLVSCYRPRWKGLLEGNQCDVRQESTDPLELFEKQWKKKAYSLMTNAASSVNKSNYLSYQRLKIMVFWWIKPFNSRRDREMKCACAKCSLFSLWKFFFSISWEFFLIRCEVKGQGGRMCTDCKALWG